MTDFDVTRVLFIILFIVILGMTLFVVYKSMKRAKLNSKLPRVTTRALVVANRKASTSGNKNRIGDYIYYITFKFETGDEYEFAVPSDAYSYYVVGDRGKLTIRGSEYISFELER